ncbi:MAG: O-antigen ligase family protein, partial [Myxococcota bacterium]
MLLEPPLDRRRNRRRDPRVLLAWAALALALVVPPQLLGGIDGWAIGSTVLLALLALGAAQYATRGAWAVPYRHPLLLAMLVLLGWTALQAMPIPCALAELLVPEAAAQVIRNRELLTDSSAGACTLSWDPGATRWEIGKGLAIVAVFTGGWLLTIAGHRRKVLIAAGASALLMAVVGLAHAAVDAERVFGLYAPRYDMPRPVLAPLLNPNQLAGFLAMGVPVLAALGLGTRDLAVRSLWLAGSAICGATTVVTLSRGGLAGLVAGLVLLGLLVTIKQRGRRTMARFGWIGGLLTVILALAAYLALEPVTRELTEGDVSKLELIGKAGLFALEHPWIGVGRGAFATAFVQGGHLAEHRAGYAES